MKFFVQDKQNWLRALFNRLFTTKIPAIMTQAKSSYERSGFRIAFRSIRFSLSTVIGLSVFDCSSIQAQSASPDDLVVLFGFPITESPSWFNSAWRGEADIRVSYYPVQTSFFTLGPTASYAFFKVDQDKIPFLSSKLHVMNVGLSLSYPFSIHKLSVVPQFDIGHSWLWFRFEAVKNLDGNGWSANPGLNLVYSISSLIRIGGNGSFTIIWPNKDVWEREDTKTQFYSLCIYLGWNFSH